MSSSDPVLTRLRKIGLGLPEVRETKTFGNPTLQAGKKTFAVLDSYQGRRCIAFEAEPTVQRRLCKGDAYARSPFGAEHGWTLAWVERGMDWEELAGLLVQSYRFVALKRMLKALDE